MSAPAEQLALDLQRKASKAAGRVKRDRGIEDALSDFAIGTIRSAIVMVAARGRPFTVEQVREELPSTVIEQLVVRPNSLGAIFYRMAKEHVIRKTGQSTQATHEAARGRSVPFWEIVR